MPTSALSLLLPLVAAASPGDPFVTAPVAAGEPPPAVPATETGPGPGELVPDLPWTVSPSAALSASAPDPLFTYEAGRWALDLSGLVTVDAIRYGHGNSKSSGLETRRGTVILEASRDDGALGLYVEPDVDGENTRHNMTEMYGTAVLGETHRLRVGLIRTGLTSEAASDPLDMPLVGTGFAAWLTGRTGWGATLDGQVTDGAWWEVAADSGAGSFDRDGRGRNDSQFNLRFVLHPDHDGTGAFEGLFGGVGLGYGSDYDDRIHVETPFEQTVFTTPDLDGGQATWVAWEVGYRGGPLTLHVEDVSGEVSDVPVGGGVEQDIDQIGSFTGTASWSFWGEAPRWERGRWQGGPVADEDGDLPLVLTTRYSNADIDRALFDTGITTFGQSTQEVRTFSGALSMWFDQLTRLTLQWTKVIADQDLATFEGRDRDSSWTLRVDRRF